MAFQINATQINVNNLSCVLDERDSVLIPALLSFDGGDHYIQYLLTLYLAIVFLSYRLRKSVDDACLKGRMFLFSPSQIYYLALFSVLVVIQTRGHIAGSSHPSPLRCVPFSFLLGRRNSALSSLVDSGRMVKAFQVSGMPGSIRYAL